LAAKILGVDLSGKDGRPTGFCLIMNNTVLSIGEFRTIRALFEYISILEPDIVAIDAPLNFPKKGLYRDCDLMLKKYGLSPLSPMLEGMQALVKRAIKLVGFLEEKKIRYIETFPAGSIRLLGFKRKPKSKRGRREYFTEICKLYGLEKIVDPSDLTKDEFDAFLCALAGYAYIKMRFIKFAGKECTIILPTL